MKIVGIILIVIGIMVGYYAYTIDITPTSLEEYNENFKTLQKQLGNSKEIGLTTDGIMQKKIAEQRQDIIIAGVIFLSGIILISRRNLIANQDKSPTS